MRATASRARRVLEALVALLGLDLLFVLVTGGEPLLDPLHPPPVGAPGFALRALLLGGLLCLRFATSRQARPDRARLLLVLLLLPALGRFHFASGRLGGDGISYYVYVRSLVEDHDLDFTNEYSHYGMLERGDLRVKTRTGLRRSIFSIGPALASLPFFLLGECVGRGQALLGSPVDLSGYGEIHVRAVALGGCLYGFAAVLLIHALLRRHFEARTALGATLLAWLATFLPFYMTEQPVMSHACSAAVAALVLLLFDRGRERSLGGYLALGLVLGLAMCVRWQNGVLLLLPFLELLARLARGRLKASRACAAGMLVLAAAALGAFPQLWAWKVLYGEYLLPAPPHGPDFLRLDHPFVFNTLFSSRHGLLSWTPVFYAGYLGFLPLLKRRPGLALPVLAPLLLMSYVNMCSGDWWAGGSFSNRRFDSVLAMLALGFAASIDWARSFLARRPELALGLIAAPFVLFNLTLVEQVRRGLVPRDESVDGPRLFGNAAALLSDAVGFPTTWPASWIFAAREGVSPGQYDLVVGRYLFYRQNNLGGHIALADRDDSALLAEGFSPIERGDGLAWRRTRGPARLFAPLDVPEDLEIRLRARAAVGAAVSGVIFVNGHEAGRFLARPQWSEERVFVPAAFWRRELNEVVIEAGFSRLELMALDFVRRAGRP